MTTPAAPLPIYLSQVNTELNLASNATIYLNNAVVRTLAGVGGSGTAIYFSDLRGKSNRVSLSYSISSNVADKSIDVSTITGYISGKSDITVTVNTGVYVYATSTANAGLTITGGATGDTVTLVNNGYILGKGGRGGGYPNNNGSVSVSGNYPVYKGFAGGPAFSAGCDLTITNTNGYIAGGGGGGHGGWGGGGGGAGGGEGGVDSGNYNTPGAGGGPGLAGGDGAYNVTTSYTPGGGGGRILPGAGGNGAWSGTYYTDAISAMSGKGGGAGGGGGGTTALIQGSGGYGGGSNNAGGTIGYYWNGSATIIGGGATGGGGWGAVGGSVKLSNQTVAGAAGGAAINKNGHTVSYSGGTVWGAVNA